MSERLWVQIPAPYTIWTWHFYIDFLLKAYCLFDTTENKRKRDRGWPIFKKKLISQNQDEDKIKRVLTICTFGGSSSVISNLLRKGSRVGNRSLMSNMSLCIGRNLCKETHR